MKKQYGLSLVELMISLTLGMVLMTGVVQMFLASRSTYTTQQAISRIQETGRLGMEFLALDIRMAGYTGCSSRNPLAEFKNGLDPDTVAVGSIYDVGAEGNPDIILQSQIGIIGYESDDDLPHDEVEDNIKDGTDVLFTRGAGTSGMSLMNEVDASANVNVSGTEVDGCVEDICQGDIVVLSDCTHARLFKITNLQGLGSGVVNLVHSSNASENPSNRDPNNWGQEFDLGAQVMKVSSKTYYVAESELNPGSSSLWQVVDEDPPVELIEGVEDMSLRYGLDTNADNIPDDYLAASDIADDDWGAVLAVRVQLLVQSSEENVLQEPQNIVFDGEDVDVSDRRMRQIFSSTIGIRSRL